MKKKNLMRSLALCLCLCLCFAACSGTGGSSSTARPASSSGGGAEPAVQGNSITFPLAEAKELFREMVQNTAAYLPGYDLSTL